MKDNLSEKDANVVPNLEIDLTVLGATNRRHLMRVEKQLINGLQNTHCKEKRDKNQSHESSSFRQRQEHPEV